MRIDLSVRRLAAWTVILLVAAAGSTDAATFRVASNGVDDEDCGRPTAPCATLPQAIENADDGDTILVGPGYYETECETFDCCSILIDKDLSIRSTEGAETTLLIGDDNEFLVCIEADGVTFGLDTKGFTLTGAYNGLRIGFVEDVYVGGNIAVECFEDGFTAWGSGHTFFRNLALDNDEAGFDMFTRDSTFTRNKALLNSEDGFRFEGVDSFASLGSFAGKQIPPDENVLSFNVANFNQDNGFVFGTSTAGNVMDRNAASANERDGLNLAGYGHSIRRFVGIGNGDQGIGAFNGPHVISDSHLVDNDEYGIDAATELIMITRCNLYGNRRDDADDCQLQNSSGFPIAAPDNFFGVPVPDPGTICGSAIDREPISDTEFSFAFGWLPVP